ncbi:MAG: hypothetical protein RJS97_08830 [Parvibaculaceae bacterium]
MILTRQMVERAREHSPWDFGNQVLYDLCRTHPEHTDASTVIAKVWLIGRSYAAAIERRRDVKSESGDFYVEKVAPKIKDSDIDNWLQIAASFQSPSAAALDTILSVHLSVTQLFGDISGLQKRSLASKYLHFHKPDLFFIYDSRAVNAMRKLSSVVGRATRGAGDPEYRKFAQKCIRLQEHIKARFGVSLTPREVDNLLLNVQAG